MALPPHLLQLDWAAGRYTVVWQPSADTGLRRTSAARTASTATADGRNLRRTSASDTTLRRL